MSANLPTVLLIDNTVNDGSKNRRIARLEDMMTAIPSNVETVRYEDIRKVIRKEDGFDCLVLSGSGMNISDPNDRDEVRSVMELVQLTDLPILGICFGFHLVLHSYGCKVMRNHASNEAPPGKDIMISVHDDEEGLLGDGDHTVNVSHRDYVSPDDPVLLKEFHVRSVSRDGEFAYVQYARHRTWPIYAFQFHPEAYEGAPEEVITTGERAVHNFIRSSTERSRKR